MPSSHGRQKRVEKQRKRRAQKKAKATRRSTTSKAPKISSESKADLQGKGANKAAADLDREQRLAKELGYSAEIAPEPTTWLELEEKEQMARAAQYHERALKPHQMPPSLPRHAALHVIVENKLAAASPPQLRAALERLMKEGLSRHHAIHAIGSLTTKHMQQAIKLEAMVDEKAYCQELDQLTIKSWLAQAQTP